MLDLVAVASFALLTVVTIALNPLFEAIRGGQE